MVYVYGPSLSSNRVNIPTELTYSNSLTIIIILRHLKSSSITRHSACEGINSQSFSNKVIRKLHFQQLTEMLCKQFPIVGCIIHTVINSCHYLDAFRCFTWCYATGTVICSIQCTLSIQAPNIKNQCSVLESVEDAQYQVKRSPCN